MLRFYLLLLIGMVACQEIYPQDALLMLKFEEAEKAFNSGEFENVLKYLDEVEGKAGVTSKTLYLRIVSQGKLLEKMDIYEEEKSFAVLSTLRENAATYLEAMAKQALDDRYREVYRISEELNKYPKTKSEWFDANKLYLAKREQHRQQEIQKVKQAERQQNLRLAKSEAEEYARGAISASGIIYNTLAEIKEPAGDFGTIYLIRPPKLSGKIVNTKIFLHNQYIFPLATKKFKRLTVSPGLVKLNALHGVSTASEKNLNSDVYRESTLTFQLEAGESYFITTALQRGIVITLISKEEGEVYLQEYEEMEEGVKDDMAEE